MDQLQPPASRSYVALVAWLEPLTDAMPRAAAPHVRTLAVDPSPRGFGFAVLEGPTHLLDWGVAELYSMSMDLLEQFLAFFPYGPVKSMKLIPGSVSRESFAPWAAAY